MKNHRSSPRIIQDAPTECDYVQIVVVTNGVECTAHKDYGEVAVKCHSVYAFVLFKNYIS
jgi:hypothetical protein